METQTQTQSQNAATEQTHLLVVIDHREARIFKTEVHGEAPHRIKPHNPHGSHRHLHYVEKNNTGQLKPESKEFYDNVIKSLAGADKILLMGSSTGSSSAMDHLIAQLKEHHPDLAKKIVGNLTINEHHMTEDQLLAEARDFYATHP